ncbi:mechanosensitive ion channel [Bacillus carboniphilus]|uniref:Mechanosensitive ion channel n=1 Tax=Bacillus carboniphilus TaxID=86663 RepID=A0ABY9JXU1_9BACI|nr:mechanosensitive ion channel domain-containing protein [Bacillus carboniphilus]WLR42440.1 mechanosensitive ion channel [Bacillus carboniphilus]
MDYLLKWLEQFNVIDFILIIAITILIMVVRLILLLSLKKTTLLKGKAFKTLINWLSFYAILIFMLVYFADAEWMTKEWIKVGKIEVTPSLILVAVFILSISYIISKTIREAILPPIFTRYHVTKGLQYTFSRIIHYIIMVIAILISLSSVGVSLNGLTVFAGLLSVGIGFGLQNITSNFISGIILLFERPIEVGDRIIIDDIIGDVKQIKMRATVVKTLHNEHIIIPNSYFLEEHVINRSYSDSKLKLVIPFGVAYGTDAERLKELIIQLVHDEAQNTPAVLLKPKPYLNFIEFGDSSLNFELFVWISNPYEYITLRSEFHYRIYQVLNQNEIEIPFPQRDIHIKSLPLEE